jgi:hypothetical protein
MTTTTRTLNVRDYHDLRDNLPTSGVFDMLDCNVEIWCPELSETGEVERMVNVIESMINILDVKVGSTIQDIANDNDLYRVVLTEVPLNIASKRSAKKDK